MTSRYKFWKVNDPVDIVDFLYVTVIYASVSRHAEVVELNSLLESTRPNLSRTTVIRKHTTKPGVIVFYLPIAGTAGNLVASLLAEAVNSEEHCGVLLQNIAILMTWVRWCSSYPINVDRTLSATQSVNHNDWSSYYLLGVSTADFT